MSFQETALAPLLRAGLKDLDLPLEPQRQELLLRHLALIERWNRVYNLTAVREPTQMLAQHLLDSLAVVRPLRRKLVEIGAADNATLLDVGSGAGLPGVALAIACPELAVSCVDAVGKKAGFIRQATAELGLPNLESIHARVEELDVPARRIVACRAFSSLPDFTRLTSALLANGGLWMAMKGKVPEVEIDQLPPGVDAFHVEPIEVPGLNAERCIVWMRKTG